MDIFTYLIFVLIFIIEQIQSIDVKIVCYPTPFNKKSIDRMILAFNQYSIEKSLNITLNKFSYEDIRSASEYSDTLAHLLLKSKSKSSNYELVMYDLVETGKFKEQLVGLNKFKQYETYTNDYVKGIAGETCVHGNKPVSIPIYLEYNMLYSNHELLQKYEKLVPKTWDELVETAKYITEQEEKEGNRIIPYSAEMADTETGFASYYEFIYSYRNETDSPYPPITNPEVEEAMEKIKEIKTEFGDSSVKASMDTIYDCLNSYSASKKCLFVKTWHNVPHSSYFLKSRLPGKKEGLSGSVLGGLSVAINNGISDERKTIAYEVLKYFASSDFQKNIVFKEGYMSASKSVYSDDLCGSYDQCQTFKDDVQYVMRPIDATTNYEEYSQQYRDYLLKFIFLDKPLKECLSGIEYLTKIYFQDNNKAGNRVISMIIGVTDILIMIAYGLSFMKKHAKKFKIFNPYYWFVYLFGLIVIMSYGFTGMGELTEIKCHIQPFVLSVGFTLSTTLLCIRLLINFPESDRSFVRFCDKHMALSLVVALTIDVVLNLLLLIDPYEIMIKTDNHVMYNVCHLDSIKGHAFLGLIFLYKIAVALIMVILVFVEWNMKEFKNDIRYATATLFISVIIYILYGIFNIVDINGYDAEFIVPSFMAYLYGVSNFFLYFVLRFFSREEKEGEINILKAKAGASSGSRHHHSSFEKYCSSNSLNGSTGGKKMSLTGRLVSLHNFGDEIKKSREVSKGSINSSGTNLSTMKSNKISRSTNNMSNGNLDDFGSMHRRASQICAIPENQIADIYDPSQTGDESNSGTKSTNSFDNFLPRIMRINSTPNKKFLGFSQGNMRSIESIRFQRKNSNVSFTNVPGSSTNVAIRKPSFTSGGSINSLENDKDAQRAVSNSNISVAKPLNYISNDRISVDSSNAKSDPFNDDDSSNNHLKVDESTRYSSPYSNGASSLKSSEDD